MSLLDSLIASSVSKEKLAKDWLREYATDSKEGFLRIATLIFQTCGLTHNLPLSVFDIGWVNFVKALEVKIPESALSTYPINDKRKKFGKHISKVVCNFFGIIFSKAEEDVLHDGFFIAELCKLLHVLTTSSLRAFRHTATLIVVKMISHLSTITKDLTLQYSRIDRQLSNCEREQLRRSSERRESLENLLAASSLRISELEETITFLISVCLPKRFRDVYISIRLLCLEELEIWLLKYPNVFLEHRNLKYLGWALSDEFYTMRRKSIEILKKIYSDNELAKCSEMELFTLKFKDRMVKMSLDKNISVSIIAIQVVSLILRQNPDMINKDDLEFILQLVYCQSIEVAYEVAQLIVQIITFALEVRDESEKSEWAQSLLELKNIVILTKGEKKIPLLVDAMLCLQSAKYLYEWEHYVEILLHPKNSDESHGSGNFLDTSLTVEEEGIIVSLMANSAKQILLNENPRPALRSKKFLTVKPLGNEEIYYECSTEFFLKYLPVLISKYLPHEDIISSLLSVCLTLDVTMAVNQFQNIHALFTSLLEVSERHVDSEVHQACDEAIAHLCKGKSSAAKFASSNLMDPHLQEIASSWESSLKEYSRKCAELEDLSDIEGGEDFIFKVEKDSNRLFVASCHFDMEKFIDWEELISLCRGYCIDEAGRHHRITTTVMKNVLKTALTYILHELPIENVEESDLLKCHIDDFLLVGQNILRATREIEYSVRIAAYHCISEIMVIICQAPSAYSCLWKNDIESTAIILMDYITKLIHREEEFHELSEKEELDLIKNYCSLLLRGGLPPEASIHLLQNINMQMIISSWSYIEITLTTLLSWDVEEFSMIVLGSLTSYYDEVLKKEGEDLLDSQSFGELMHVTEKIYKYFGSKMGGDSKAILKFHLKGIRFATKADEEEIVLLRIHFSRLLIVFAPAVNSNLRNKLLDYLAEHKRSLMKKLPSVPEDFINDLPLFNDYTNILSSSEWVNKPKKQTKRRSSRAVVIPEFSAEDGEEMEID